jgi:cytochrome c peroxidase
MYFQQLRIKRVLASVLVLTLTAGSALGADTVREGTCPPPNPFPDTNPGPGTLKQVPVIQPTNLSDYVRNRNAAIALGKALFWDMQIGSDGIQACASCHFRAGADPRSINQLNPGGNDNPNTTFQLGGPNYQLKASDFPLHKLSDPNNRLSQVLQSYDEVVSSQGVKLGNFLGVQPGAEKDLGYPVHDSTFNLYGLNTRRGEPRNTPTVINAAYNRRQFWDGRADNIFNGVNEFGVRDPNARVLRATGLNQIDAVKIRIDHASLASQAVGPIVSNREMAFDNRPKRDIGKRIVSAKPLKKQLVAIDDSVLAPYVDRANGNKGLTGTYQTLIEAAFEQRWWRSNLIVRVALDGSVTYVPRPNRNLLPNEYTMMEYNFPLFFGLAVQLYEMILISDDSPVDRYFDGNPNALTAAQKRGLEVFTGEAACAACHAGAETTNNSTRILFGAVVDGVKEPAEIVERMFNGNCEVVVYDQSFYNIGVRPTEEDLGIGVKDPFGNPLAWADIITTPPSMIPSQELLTIPVPNIANPPIYIGERTSTKGAFKVPNLRNIELTAPYFHNGGQATLRQVIEFYNRGGDFREHNSQFIDFEIGIIGLTNQEIDDLVEFLKALTDARVLQRKAPFDHPQLFVPDGHQTIAGFPIPDVDGAKDKLIEIPAAGRNGGPVLKGFLEP